MWLLGCNWLLLTFLIFFLPQMCHLQTHVVIDAGDKEIYMAAYNANQDMDYNDFSV